MGGGQEAGGVEKEEGEALCDQDELGELPGQQEQHTENTHHYIVPQLRHLLPATTTTTTTTTKQHTHPHG